MLVNAKVWSKVYGYGIVHSWYDFSHIRVRFFGEDEEIICHVSNIKQMAEA